jgi:hypothetical protein
MFSIVFGAALTLGVPAVGAERALESKDIEKLAKVAQSPAEHAKVAKHYRLRAESLTEKADRLEREVREQKASPSPMAQKWPAMVVNARERKEQVAMQARRAAQESLMLAERHEDLAAGESVSAQ